MENTSKTKIKVQSSKIKGLIEKEINDKMPTWGPNPFDNCVVTRFTARSIYIELHIKQWLFDELQDIFNRDAIYEAAFNQSFNHRSKIASILLKYGFDPRYQFCEIRIFGNGEDSGKYHWGI